MNRALLWLLGGLLVLVLAVLAIAPELLGGAVFETLGLALVAAVPAVLVAALFVSSRRRRGIPPRGAAAPRPTPAHPDDPLARPEPGHRDVRADHRDPDHRDPDHRDAASHRDPTDRPDRPDRGA